jgi:uncharacterized membrane protein YdjX (TVP38/TMEM64 family)
VSPARRLVILLLALCGLVLAAVLLPLERVPAAVAGLGPLAPLAGVLIGSALLVALVPRTPISLACGLLFGPVLGTVCALVVSVAAAVITFAAGRKLGREFLVRHAGRRLTRLDGWISRQGVLSVAAVRSLPIGPYGLAGYAYGATGVPVRDYIVGTAVAAPPAAVAYAMIGAAVGSPGGLDPVMLVPAGAGLVLAAVAAARSRRRVATGVTGPVATGMASPTPTAPAHSPPRPAPRSSR